VPFFLNYVTVYEYITPAPHKENYEKVGVGPCISRGYGSVLRKNLFLFYAGFHLRDSYYTLLRAALQLHLWVYWQSAVADTGFYGDIPVASAAADNQGGVAAKFLLHTSKNT